ncbi:hypothetical protein GCM10023115_25510 [Pontixanthobacter gangjinensis]
MVDDGSSDNTSHLLEFYSERDNRIKYLERPNNLPRGANSCRNFGFEKSQGEFIQWLDSDDLLATNKIENQLRKLTSLNEEIISSKWGKLRDGDVQFFEDLESYQDFNSLSEFLDALDKSEGYFPIHSYLMSKDIVARAGYWNETLKVNQDGEFMIRIFLEMNSMLFTKDTFVLYRKDSSSSTSLLSKKSLKHLVASWKLIQSHLIEKYPDLGKRYVDNAKRRIFIKYRESPKLINSQRDFFGNIPDEEPSDFRLAFYRVIVKYWLSRNILRFLKNLKRGRISVEKVE